MKKLTLILTLLLSTFFVKAQFGSGSELTNGAGWPTSVSSADIDGDGMLDVLSSSSQDSKIAWYKNLGGGVFGVQQVITNNAINLTTHAIDMDGDGDLDVLWGGSLGLSWNKNLGGGVFDPNEIIISAGYVNDVYSGDIDGDGDLDILSASSNIHNIAWYENLGGGTFGTQQVISTNVNGASSVYTADVDGDGDLDILSASFNDDKIAWYENQGGGIFGVQQAISVNADGAKDVTAADLDGDGDLDILSASSNDDKIAWYENQGGGVFGPEQTLTISADIANAVYTADFDGDGDLDVLWNAYNSNTLLWLENLGGGFFGTSHVIVNYPNNKVLSVADIDGDGDFDVLEGGDGSQIMWYENLGTGTFGAQQYLTTVAWGVSEIYAVDLDGDGDQDVLSASSRDDKIAWYENLGGGTFGTQQVISTSANGASSVYTADLDGDGDLDVLSAEIYGDKIAWYENQGGGAFGIKQIISTSANGASSVYAGDLDGDGDQDVFSASSVDDKIAWYENQGGGVFGVQQIISVNAENAHDVTAADLDGDGDLDVLSASLAGNRAAWYENLGGGTFGPENILSTVTYGAAFVSTTDIDGDGDLDVLSAYYNTQTLLWYENLGGGTFGSENIISNIVSGLQNTHATDLDGDGDQDILVSTSSYPKKLLWFENLGGGTFGLEQVIPAKPSSTANNNIFSADLDLDGDQDVLLSSTYQIYWYENQNYYSTQIEGELFFDVNQNGVNDSIDLGLSGILVNSTPQSDFSYTHTSGKYFMNFSDTPAVYQISPQTPNYWSLVTDSLSYTVRIDSNYSYLDSLNFGFYPDTIINDIHAEIIGSFPRCNDTINYWLDVKNNGTTLPSGIIHLKLHDSISYIGSIITPDSISGQNLYWHYDSLFYFANEQINLQALMPDFNSIGEILTSYLTVSVLDSTGAQVLLLSDSLNEGLLCAYDPNDKIADPMGIDSLGYISNSIEFLEYTVRFQNTGNDTAATVIIKDQLDTNLEWNTLTLLASSHTFQTDVDQNGEITFKFENISLPDSGADFLGSQGFIKYKIDIKTGLIPGTSIFNTAHIYFDQNPAVITNTKINTIYDCTEFIPNTISNLNACQNDTISGFASDDLSTTEFTWDISNVYNSVGVNFSWLADTAGTFYLTLSATNSTCNKDTTIVLNVNPAFISNQNDTICQGDSLSIYGIYQSVSGVYYDSLQTINGCDSLFSTTLLINPVFSYNQNDSICPEDSILVYGIYQNIAGTYYDSLQTINGCDSILSTTLTINPVFSSNQNDAICQGDSILLYGSYQNTAGIYYDSLQTINGCDSILSTTLSVNPIFSSNQNDAICQGDSLLIYGSYQNTSAIYYDSLQTINGCDSIFSTTLNVNPIFSSNQNNSICQGDSVLLYGIYQNTAGIYYDSLQTINGCDSIFSTTLTINTLPSASLASFNPDTLCDNASAVALPTGSPTGGNYSGNGVIGGNFDPSIAGIGTHDIIYTYTDGNSCINSDTTFVTIDVCTGINNVSTDFGIIIYPNPSTGQFTIEKPNDLNKEVQIKLLDANSKLILEKVIPIGKQKVKMDIRNYSKGIYYLHLIIEDEQFVKQILKN